MPDCDADHISSWDANTKTFKRRLTRDDGGTHDALITLVFPPSPLSTSYDSLEFRVKSIECSSKVPTFRIRIHRDEEPEGKPPSRSRWVSPIPYKGD